MNNKEVKAGQIWRQWSFDTPKLLAIITVYDSTNIYDDTGKRLEINKCRYIYDSGITFSSTVGELIATGELVSEYPTWHDAVNSKEFKGEE